MSGAAKSKWPKKRTNDFTHYLPFKLTEYLRTTSYTALEKFFTLFYTTPVLSNDISSPKAPWNLISIGDSISQC